MEKDLVALIRKISETAQGNGYTIADASNINNDSFRSLAGNHTFQGSYQDILPTRSVFSIPDILL
jgi:hypothetical protein